MCGPWNSILDWFLKNRILFPIQEKLMIKNVKNVYSSDIFEKNNIYMNETGLTSSTTVFLGLYSQAFKKEFYI